MRLRGPWNSAGRSAGNQTPVFQFVACLCVQWAIPATSAFILKYLQFIFFFFFFFKTKQHITSAFGDEPNLHIEFQPWKRKDANNKFHSYTNHLVIHAHARAHTHFFIIHVLKRSLFDFDKYSLFTARLIDIGIELKLSVNSVWDNTSEKRRRLVRVLWMVGEYCFVSFILLLLIVSCNHHWEFGRLQQVSLCLIFAWMFKWYRVLHSFSKVIVTYCR
jgi:hypothetical protein